jgi:tetratricopeptide (TPR) repeat protein
LVITDKKTKRYGDAKRIYRMIISLYPDPKAFYVGRARMSIPQCDIMSYVETGEDDRAFAVLDEFVSSFAGHEYFPEAIFVIGERYCLKAVENQNEQYHTSPSVNFQNAIAVWKIILQELEPYPGYTPKACYYIARCYRQLGDYDNALDYYQRVVADWPDYEHAMNADFLMRYCLEQLSRDEREPK